MHSLLFLAALPMAAQYSGAIDASSSSGVEMGSMVPGTSGPLAVTAPRELRLGTPDYHRSFRISLASLLAANALDAVSSRGGYELNPILGRGNFGAHQEAIKGAFVGALVVGELLVVRRWPRSARAFMWCNFAGAGVTASMAARNLEVIR